MNTSEMSADSRLHAYYESRLVEAERLGRREGQLELERTRELISRHLPASPSRIIDIGGGTGVYAAWLTSVGHQVHMVDIVQAHIDAAAKIGTFSAAVGDARDVGFIASAAWQVSGTPFDVDTTLKVDSVQSRISTCHRRSRPNCEPVASSRSRFLEWKALAGSTRTSTTGGRRRRVGV